MYLGDLKEFTGYSWSNDYELYDVKWYSWMNDMTAQIKAGLVIQWIEKLIKRLGGE